MNEGMKNRLERSKFLCINVVKPSANTKKSKATAHLNAQKLT